MGTVIFGLRNVLRNKPRLALVAVLIGIPFFLFFAMQAIGNAVSRQTAVLTRDVNTLLQLRARGSMGHVNMVGQDRILPEDVLDKVRGIGNIVDVEPYLLAMAPITPPNFVMHVGLAPTAVKRLESHGEAGNPRIVAGRDFTPEDTGKNVAIIGQGYAQWAGIKPEDMGTATLTVDATRTHPVIFAMDRPKRDLKIIGTYASGYVFGDLQLFLPIDTFRAIYGIDRGISWVFVRVDSVENVAIVAERLRATVGDVADILVPRSAAVFTATTSRTVLQLVGAAGLVAITLMAIVVFFVLVMQVRERTREIGTLKAIGAANGRIVAQFFTEAVSLSLLGGAVGLAIFLIVGDAAVSRLFALGVGPFLPSQYRPLFESLAIDTQLSAHLLALALLVAVVTAVTGGAYGVWQAIRLSPVEAMKHE
ncbi:MAG: FtsX-like permease family protein [Rhizobiales bacterium]|nr:FtsX-like permease family protein [Hyphomicrobiales bacterium]